MVSLQGSRGDSREGRLFGLVAHSFVIHLFARTLGIGIHRDNISFPLSDYQKYSSVLSLTSCDPAV